MPEIKHFIVLMLENRAFDHLFGFFQPTLGQTINNLLGAAATSSNLLDPAKPESDTNPRFTVKESAPFAVHDKEGPSHSFNSTCVQLCNDKAGPTAANPVRNNGFVRSYKDELLRRTHQVDRNVIAEVITSFAPVQLPTINKLAEEFCLCDRWHCEVPGPTMPNRMYVHAATSEGYVHNNFKRIYNCKTIYQLVEEKGLTWAVYFHDLNEAIQFQGLAKTPEHFRRFDERWASDVQNGDLPNYVFIFPRFLNKGSINGQNGRPANSQHAPEDVRFGEHLIADVYDALAANHDLWKDSVLIVTYDENGGFYDHIPPPGEDIPNPDGIDSPNADDTATFTVPTFSFDRLGFRVPAIIASPRIAKGAIENRRLQHTSVIKTATEIFGLAGPLNERDKSAASFADLLNNQPRPKEDMPVKLPRPSLENAVFSTVAGVAVDPGDEPLDSLTEQWVRDTVALTGGEITLAGATVAPETQGAASDLVERLLKNKYGI